MGSLLYLFATRPDICAAVVEPSRHVSNPTTTSWHAARHILKYLAGTADKGIAFTKSTQNFTQDAEVVIKAFSDSDWVGSKTTRRSISGFVAFMAGGPIRWKSKKQSVVALSSCEAEYIAITETAKEVIWLIQHLRELGFKVKSPVSLLADNQAAIALSKNPVHHQRSKHIDIRHHFLRDKIKDKMFKMEYVSTEDNIADVMTKAVSAKVFNHNAPHLVQLATRTSN